MDGSQLTICIVALALVWGGVSVTRAILDYKSKKAAEESNSGITKRLLEAQEFASEQETERLKIASRWRGFLNQNTGLTAIHYP